MSNRRSVAGQLCLLVTIALVIAACGNSAAAPSTPSAHLNPGTTQRDNLTINGLIRSYRLFQPASLDPKQAPPLVLLLHGCGPNATGDQIAATTHFDDLATSGRFVAAYPDGVGGCWNTGACCGTADDVTFISRLLDRLTTDLPIDRTRVFIAGYSGGAGLSHRLGCQLSGRIAAIASVGGAMLTDCQPAHPVSVLEMHGTADDTAPMAGGVLGLPSPSVLSVMQRWASLDGCGASPIPSQTGIMTTSMWKGCKAGRIVQLDAITGGHHTWFGSKIDPVPGEPDANAVIWAFFTAAVRTQP